MATPRGRIAILSDVHANAPALQAVWADIDRLGDVTECWCLGDLVGYGADPAECVRSARARCRLILKGNHEAALAGGAERFNERARAAIDWTREALAAEPDGAELLAFLAQIPTDVTLDAYSLRLVHGSPAEPTEEYLNPRDAGTAKVARQWKRMPRYAFCGHTHLPGVFEPGAPFARPADMLAGGVYALDGAGQAIINVGSIGQPRDRDPRACYAVFDGDSLVFRRVVYDVAEARRRILANPRLSAALGDRLVEGR